MERFLSKIEKTETCWIWKAGCSGDGYGAFHIKRGQQTSAHRFSYIIHKGEIPANCVVRHSCDNPKCVNPSHLDIGTIQDNTNDKINRNRQARGERHGRSKLTAEQVLLIREKALTKYHGYLKAIADEFNISSVQVQYVIKKKSWKHIQ